MSAVEISVKDAAAILSLTERQVRNHIKARNIHAIKVGKEWFVDSASVEAFRRRYRLPKVNAPDTQASASPSVDPTKQANPEDAPLSPTNITSNEGSDRTDSSHRKASKNEGQQIFKLNCYKLCVEAFSTWTPLNSEPAVLYDLQYAALKNLGAGYYSFDFRAKCEFYRKSRASIGSLLAITFSRKDWKMAHQREIDFLEQKLLPALSALIRKMEKKTR